MNEKQPIVHLVPKAPSNTVAESTAAVIEHLEKWLALARNGELRSIAVAAVYNTDQVGCGFSAPASYGLQSGAIAELAYTYAKANE